jgi:hypothetical protein
MYAESIISSNISRVCDRLRVEPIEFQLPNGYVIKLADDRYRVNEYPSDVISEMVEHLEKLVDRRTGEFIRDLTREEERFMLDETIRCQLDWRHWNENYVYIELASQSDKPEGWDLLKQDSPHEKSGAGPLGKFLLNGMQIALLQKLAELELIAQDQSARGAPVNGILLILLKARQLGASTLWQSLLRHRANFYHSFPTLVASMDQESTELLHRRSERMYDKLPTWMRAIRKRRTVDGGEEFVNGSIIALQNFKQEKDLGKGETWRGFHGTEISSIASNRYEDHIEEGLFPAIPYDRMVLFGMESTAKGKTGPWYDFCTQVMSSTAEGGAGRFSEFFAPFYLIDAVQSGLGQRSKYQLEAPSDWMPSANTLRVAATVKDTSHLYMPDKSTVTLSREVLYWYETTRSMLYRRGKLNIFLQSYPTTPDEAFQHSASGAFTTETIERLANYCAEFEPWPYRIISEDERESIEQWSEPLITPIHSVSGHLIGPMHLSELDKDYRGIIYFWEQPLLTAHYALGCDPAGGIPRWSRAFRQHNDINKDNGTIEIKRKTRGSKQCEDCNGLGWIRTEQPNVQAECPKCDARGKVGGRAIQVAEFAAPIDPEELALYVFILGHLFRGDSDLDECVAIIERNNTGIVTIRKLQNTFGYSNLWGTQSLTSGEQVKEMGGVGWLSTPQTVPILHARYRIVIVRRDVEIRSRHLVKELADAVVKVVGQESEKSKAISTYERFLVMPGGGRHDDLMTASALVCWVLFDWTEIGDGELAVETAGREMPPGRNFAATDATAAMQRDYWNQIVELHLGEQDLRFGHYDDCDGSCTSSHELDDQDLDQEEFDSEFDYDGEEFAWRYFE